MKCKDIQEWLPLYAGRDLDERRASLVGTHLQSCHTCAEVAREYHEARQLAQHFAAPAFSETLYTGIRQNVLREIRKEAATPALPGFFAGLWRPGLRWAVATSLLLAFSVLAIYFIASRRSEPLQAVHNEGNGPSPATPPSPVKVSRDTASSQASDGHKRQPRIPGRQFQRRNDRPSAGDRANSRKLVAPDSTANTTAAANGNINPIEERDASASERPLRMEIQTQDPNIRIIWFSQSNSKPAIPNAKGI